MCTKMTKVDTQSFTAFPTVSWKCGSVGHIDVTDPSLWHMFVEMKDYKKY